MLRRTISAERRRSLSLDQFRERAARWLADSDMSWQLAHRRVGAATLKGDSCNVTVAPVARGRPWVVRLKREGEAWKLSRVGFRQRR